MIKAHFFKNIKQPSVFCTENEWWVEKVDAGTPDNIHLICTFEHKQMVRACPDIIEAIAGQT